MEDHSNQPFRLGTWLVEPSLNRLTRVQNVLHVEPKTMAVLVYLYSRAGEVVRVDDIVTAVWHDRPMGDNPVYKAIAKLRRALGDDPKDPTYIFNVPRMGYRLVVPSTADPAPIAPAAVAVAMPGRVRQIRPAVIGLAVGIAIAAALMWRPNPAPPSIRPLSAFPGSHSQPSFSPDGESFAFISDANGTPHVWILELSSTNARQVAFGDQADSRPRWSPDGHTILFSRANSLWSVPVTGGEAREVVRDAYNPNWSRDGKHIVFERRYQVWTADADGAGQTRVEEIPRAELLLAPRWPAFSPDGKKLVYFHSVDTPMGDLRVVDIEAGGESQSITFDPAIGSAPVWSPDGKSIYYSSMRGGSRTLWRVVLDGNRSAAVLISSGDDDFPDVSPDGTHLIYSNSRERFALVATDPATGMHRRLHESRLPVVGPELSPDGSQLAFFAEARTGGFQLFTMPLAGGTPVMHTSNPREAHALPQWAADGKSLYFFHTASDTSFSRLTLSAGTIETVAEGFNWNVANGARLSPTGEFLIYSRLTGQSPVQTLIRDLATAGDTTFYATLEYPRYSRDGAHIIGSRFVDLRFPGDIAVCPVEGIECRTISRDARIPVWSADETLIYYVRGFGLSQDLYVQPADGSGTESRLMTMASLFPLGPFYAVAPDGTVVWVRHDTEPGEIWLARLAPP